MSPRRKKRFQKMQSRKAWKIKIRWYFWLLPIFLAIFLLISFCTKFWSSKDKLSLVVFSQEGDINVVTFDPFLNEITQIHIPGSTQVNVSRQLGTWKIKSVWQLGENEGSGGRLLAETVTKNFAFPLYAWADSPAEGLAESRLWPLVLAVFKPYATNLKIGDRLKIALFSLKITNANRVEIDLAQTSYLKRVRLVDGELGYLVEEASPDNILVVFSDPKIASGDFKVNLKNLSGQDLLPDAIGRTLQVLGAKIASVTEEKSTNLDCEVAGKDARFTRKVAEIYGCKILKKAPASFDLEITVGEAFARRY